VIMEHTTRKGGPRLLEACSLPLTAPACVKRVYTDLAVLSVGPDGFTVHEIIPGMSQAELQAATGAKLIFALDCGVIAAPDLADEA
jgi:3-oxoadipate CoA-transferase beta subunit